MIGIVPNFSLGRLQVLIERLPFWGRWAHLFFAIFTNLGSGFHLMGGTISAMKAYALKHQDLGVDENTQPEVQYGSKPSSGSRYATREMAAADCVRLNQIQVRFGSHCCAFAVDQLPEGDFAIICACYPRLQGAV
jgi:hypothetical protein